MIFWKKLLSVTLSLSIALPFPLYANDDHSTSSQEATQDSVQLALDFSNNDELLEQDKNVTPLSIDIFSLLAQKTIKEKIRVSGFSWSTEDGKPNQDESNFKAINEFHAWNDLTVKLVSSEGDVRFEKNLSEFAQQIAGYGDFAACDAQACRIELTKEDPYEKLNSKTLHQFFLDTNQVAVLGPYILFISKQGDQNLKFINLSHFENLIGRDSIPVFEIPLNVEGGIQKLEADGSQLLINGNKHLSANNLTDLAPLFSGVFNVAAHMVDPGAMAGAAPLYSNLGAFIEREFKSVNLNEAKRSDHLEPALLTQEKFIEDIKTKLEVTQGKHSSQNLRDQSEKATEAYEKWIKQSEQYKKSVKSSQVQIQASRKLFARARQALGYISKPLPESSGKIKRAIKIVIGDTLKSSQSIWTRFGEVLDGKRPLKELMSGSDIKRTAAIAGAIALSQSVPGSYVAFAGDGLLYAKEVVGYFSNLIYGYWDSYGTSFTQVGSLFSGFQPIYDQYIDPSQGRFYKFMVGSSVLMGSILTVLGAYHISKRLWDLYQDKKALGYKDLILRQNRIEERFAKLVSEGEALQAQNKAEALKSSMTPEELNEPPSATKERLRQVIQDRKNQKGFIGKWLQKIKKEKNQTQKDLSKIDEGLKKLQELDEKDFRPIQSKWQALKHLLISTASYRATVGEYTGFFNLYASYRYSSFGWSYLPGLQKKFDTRIPFMIKVRPFGIASRLLYPEFFNVAVNKREGKITYPTALNGGMTSLAEKGMEWISRSLKKRSYTSGPEQLELFAQLQDRTPYELKREIEKQKVFEDKIIDIEGVVIKESINSAIGELTRFVKSDKDIRWLFTQSNGVSEITSQQIGLLNLKNKVFVRSYMDLLYSEAMKEILKETTESLEQAPRYSSEKGSLATVGELKKLKKSLIEQAHSAEKVESVLNFSQKKVQTLVQKLAQRKDLIQKAKSRAKWASMGLPNPKVIGNHLKTEITASMDGNQNPSMKNYEIVREMKKDEVAMARATRNEISTLFRTLPIDIAMKFIATAGITMGIMAPIQESFWGPNSVAYLSQYSFYGSLLAGIAFSSVASGWGKLRQDYYDSADGLFGDIPKGEDAEGSYWKWFWKKWKGKENRLTKYWKNYIKIVFWNIPAAIPQIIMLNYLFLGRFDMDAFIMGYIAAFTMPFSAFFFKMDQVFEQSSYYAARGLKEKDLADPEVQMWLQPEMQKLRNKFTVVRDLTMNPLIEAVANAEVTPTKGMGPRALARYIFGGYTPTEYVVLKMREISELSGSSVVKKIVDSCEHFLTNGNPDLVKIPKKGP